MAYITLRELYYGEETTYKQEYLERLHASTTIRLDFEVAQKPAFFVQSNEVISMLVQIIKRDKEVCKLLYKLPGKAASQYSMKCLIDEIVLTNNIEGVYSSRKEVGEVLRELETRSREQGKKKRFEGLVSKYLKLMREEYVPLNTCQDIRKLYDEIVLDEVIEENPNHAPDGTIFRKDLTEIKSSTDRVIHKGLYPEREIIEAMDKALAFLNDGSIEKLYRVCIFHYFLEYIHPFYDGNGRLGRFILSYCLSEEMEYLLAYRISETIKENISAYYKAFEICNDPHNLGDLTPFLIMMLQIILTSAEELYQSLSRRLTSWKRYEKLIPDFPNASKRNMEYLYNLLIQAALFGEAGISTKELVSVLEVSYGTVKKLCALVPQNMLITTKVGREKYYKLDLKILDDMVLAES